MAASDGNGWVYCRCGQRHWGRYGAAGLLLVRPGSPDPARTRPARTAREPDVLLQLRAEWTHEGGRWGLVGGAQDSHEDARAAALREAAEEAGVDATAVRVLGLRIGLDHVDWRYTYVLGVVDGVVRPRALTSESDDLRWVPLGQVPGLPLHRGLEGAWGDLTGEIARALSADTTV